MTRALFPHASPEECASDLRAILARPDAALFVAEREGEGLAGFVEVGARSIADGCATSPVGYIEAWYVDPDVRRSGLGGALIAAAESWARERGYREMASDALIGNDVSHAAHGSLGYTEVDRVITYRKDLVSEVEPPNVRQAVPFFWVADIQRSLRFYVEGLGARKTREWLDKGRLRWCWLEIGDAALMLQEFWSEGHHRNLPDAPVGIGVSINFICADALHFYREVAARGIEAKTPFVGNGMWVTGITDPDGYSLFFESPASAPEETVFSEEDRQ